jgi:hypothetical protein
VLVQIEDFDIAGGHRDPKTLFQRASVRTGGHGLWFLAYRVNESSKLVYIFCSPAQVVDKYQVRLLASCFRNFESFHTDIHRTLLNGGWE